MELKHHQNTALNYLLSISIYFILGCSISECKQRNYNGDKILRVEVSNQKEWKRVESIMQKYTAENDIWSSPATLPSFGDIRVSPEEHDIVTSQLKEFGLSFKVFIDDVQDFINAEKAESTNTTKPFRRKRATMSNQIIGTYATYEEIVEYIEAAEKNFEIASIVNIGDSLEGRPLLVLKLGIPHPDPKVVKPVVWIDAAIHAREWIAPASLMYIVYQLLNGYHEKDPVIFDLLKRIDWMFLPVVNPDGFVYSHTDERLWRKNRAIVNGSTCMGVDLNRNFDFHWGEETASDDPCHVMYRGDSPASEVETRLVQHFLLENQKSIFVYISLHSYSQFWFSRWAYTEEKVATHDEMYGLAKRATDALIKVHGTEFRVGRPFELLYGYSGGSADFAYGAAAIPFSYTIELRDKGQYAFLLPVEQIIPQGQELYAGILVVAEHIKNISQVDFSFLDFYEAQAITPDDVNHFHFTENESSDVTTYQPIEDGYGIARQGQTTAVLISDLFAPVETTSPKNLPSIPPRFQTVTHDYYDTTSPTNDDVTTTKDFHHPRGLLRGSSSDAQSSTALLCLSFITLTHTIYLNRSQYL